MIPNPLFPHKPHFMPLQSVKPVRYQSGRSGLLEGQPSAVLSADSCRFCACAHSLPPPPSTSSRRKQESTPTAFSECVPLSFSGLRWLQAHGSGRSRQTGLPAWAGSVLIRRGGSAGVQKRSGVRQQVLKREGLENQRLCGRRRSWCPRAASRWTAAGFCLCG